MRWTQKCTFSKVLLFRLNIFGYNQQNLKIERKNKKKFWSKFRKKTWIICRMSEWIIALFVFLSKFLPFFCFSFNRWILCFWWLLCYILKDQYYYSPESNIFFVDSSHEKIKLRLRWPCQNVEIFSSLTPPF